MKAIILLGPPGSGKGTQAELLAENLGFYYFETSKILEREFARAKKSDFVKIGTKKYYIHKEKELWEKGILCSPAWVSYLTKKAIRDLFKKGENLLLAGSPRTLEEAKKIMPLLKKFCGPKNIKVILITLSADTSIFRNSHRRLCQLMRHPILYTKETARLTKCPLDGSKLITRKGLDEAETIKRRLKEYQERTFPLVNYFKKQGLKIKEVNGEQSVADVFGDILKSLKS